MTGLAEVLRKQGKEVVSQVLAFEVMPAPPAIASLLRIKIDERIYFSRRVRYVDGKPLMLEVVLKRQHPAVIAPGRQQ